jgi:hypothetical protein
VSFPSKFFSYHTIVDCINVFKRYPMFESDQGKKKGVNYRNIFMLEKTLEKKKGSNIICFICNVNILPMYCVKLCILDFNCLQYFLYVL